MPGGDELLSQAARREMIVQLAPRVDDVCVQHHWVRVPDVDLKPLAVLVAKHARLCLVVLNGLRWASDPIPLGVLEAQNVYFDIAMLESVGGLVRLLREKEMPLKRDLFGSNLPLFNLEAALLKLQESELSDAEREAIVGGNASRIGKSS